MELKPIISLPMPILKSLLLYFPEEHNALFKYRMRVLFGITAFYKYSQLSIPLVYTKYITYSLTLLGPPGCLPMVCGLLSSSLDWRRGLSGERRNGTGHAIDGSCDQQPWAGGSILRYHCTTPQRIICIILLSVANPWPGTLKLILQSRSRNLQFL